MRTEAGKMPESLIFSIRNGHGVSNDRFGFMLKQVECCLFLVMLLCMRKQKFL